MRIAVGVFAWLLSWFLAIGPAAAHGPAPLDPDALWRPWSFDPLILMPLLLSAWLYGRGLRLLWTRAGRGRGVTLSHALAFGLGMVVLFIALVSPLDALGETLLSAHMAQHALLVTAAPLLLLLGKPGVVFAWALPPEYRKHFLASRVWRALATAGGALSRPLYAAVLHGLALWNWHAPGAFDAAVAHYGVHVLEHASFFGTAVLFWRSILDARSRRRAAAALGAAFATLVHGGLLGALITLAPYPLYAWYHDRTAVGIKCAGRPATCGAHHVGANGRHLPGRLPCVGQPAACTARGAIRRADRRLTAHGKRWRWYKRLMSNA